MKIVKMIARAVCLVAGIFVVWIGINPMVAETLMAAIARCIICMLGGCCVGVAFYAFIALMGTFVKDGIFNDPVEKKDWRDE